MEKKHLVKIEQSYEFSIEDINDLMVAALEGGINYWCCKALKVRNKSDGKFKGVSDEDQSKINYASDLIGYGGELILIDSDDEDETYRLNIDKMLKGIAKYCTEEGMLLSELIVNHDANTADCIVQYAIFDELRFC